MTSTRGSIGRLRPDLSGVQSDEKYPDLTAQLADQKGDWGHVQVAGILRWIGVEVIGDTDPGPGVNQGVIYDDSDDGLGRGPDHRYQRLRIMTPSARASCTAKASPVT